ncbi:GNAT family N-acetyltransferase [Streptacidiphilus rugosus]|uniref:GNAT family N-acetyltransferase n=1 Tax=Streptacidiphilus rugosus TaxID=405783 RepID=UPI00055E40C9|nr:GNAT family N-acetyltransferase [Streptacidiphilus rugosus]
MTIESLGFRTDVSLLELAGSVVTDHGTHLVVRTPANPGFYWGNFLLLGAPPRPGDAARWSALFAAEFPDARHRAFGVDGVSGDAGDSAERAALGVTAEITTVLTARGLLPSTAGPHADIRALSGDDDWRQALELDYACYGLPSDDNGRRFAERRVAGYRGLCEAGHGSWIGAFVDGRLRAGAGLFATGPELARFQNVETHPDFRRRGLAAAVLRHAARHALPAAADRTLVIVADPDDDAIRLYRALGFADAERQVQLQRAG